MPWRGGERRDGPPLSLLAEGGREERRAPAERARGGGERREREMTMVTMMGMFLPHAPPPHLAPDVVPDADDVDHVGA